MGLFSFYNRIAFYHMCLGGSVGKMCFRPVFSHPYVLLLLYIFKLDVQSIGSLSRRKASLEPDSFPRYMNERRKQFTFPFIYVREIGYLMMRFFME